jgi:hypothetical protein
MIEMCYSFDLIDVLIHASYLVMVRWDCSFNFGSLVQEVDGHTAILYHRLQLDWYPM